MKAVEDFETMAEKQRVLFFTDRIFWPANDGHKVVLTNYCKGLVEQYGCEVHALSFLEVGQSADEALCVPSYIASVELAEKPAKQTVAINLVKSLVSGSKGGPIQCSIFKNSETEKHLRDVVERLRPSYVFIDLPRLSPYLACIKDFPSKKVLYMEDIFSARYSRQLNISGTLKETGGIAGKYGANLNGCLARLASNRFLQRIVLSIESRRMRGLELAAPALYDYVILVSPIEASSLAEETGATNVIAVPLGVDCPYFISGPEPEPRKNVLSFLGDMRVSANADSLRYIAGEVLPLIGPEVVLEVSGNVDEGLVNEFMCNPQVEFLGRVEDTRETLRSTSAFLAPIAYGTGIKTKILEAMAIGVPIITNSIGNEGIGLVNGIEAFVSDNAAEQAVAVRKLFKDRDLAARLVSAARKKAIGVFDWDKSIANFSVLGLKRHGSMEEIVDA